MYLIEKMQYTGSNRAVKIRVYSTVLNWKEPLSQLRQLCFCIMLCTLSRAIWRGSFPGFETKYFVNLVFMLQCPVCYCSCISYLVLWKSAQSTFDMSSHVRGESDHYFCPIQEPVTWQRFWQPHIRSSRGSSLLIPVSCLIKLAEFICLLFGSVLRPARTSGRMYVI